MLSELRAKLPVSYFDLGQVKIQLFGGSWRDLRMIRSLGNEIPRLVASVISEYLGTSQTAGIVPLVCLGRNVTETQLPAHLREQQSKYGRAFWWPKEQSAVIDMSQFESLQEFLGAVVHEFSHALVTLLAYPYVYPRAVHEALATTVQYRFAYEVSPYTELPRPSIHWTWSRGRFVPNRFIPMRELLGQQEQRAPIDHRFHWGSYALLAFMASLNYVLDAPLEGALIEARRHGMSSPRFHRWLADRLKIPVDELDEGFRRYCEEGWLP